jgi:hypothetical protein
MPAAAPTEPGTAAGVRVRLGSSAELTAFEQHWFRSVRTKARGVVSVEP